MAKVQAQASYTSANIEVLEGLEAVRKRVGMYLGSKDERGAYKAFDEIVDNCIDEHLAGHGKLIRVRYDLKTGFVIVADQGRGIPVDIHPKTKESTLTTVLTKLHAGGKFNGENGSYVQSGGLNGVGASCTNAVSDSFEAWSYQNKIWNYQKFSKGKALTKVIPRDPPGSWGLSKRGTIIRFHLDPEIFGTNRIDPKRMCIELKDKAYLNPGLEIQAIVGDKKFKFIGEHGLLSMVYDEKRKESMLGKPWRMFEAAQTDVAVCWYDDDEVVVKSYVNSIKTGNDGTHVDGFKQALTKALRELSGTDFESKYWMKGMRVALNWRMTEPDFRGQTKDELASPIDGKLRDLIYPKLALWFKQNPQMVKRLTDRASAFKKNEDKFKADNKAIKALEVGGKDDRGIDPSKLIQADPSVPPHLRELVLVEGASAGGTCRQARMKHHEILMLRGVSINAQRQESGKVLANKEIRLLIKALGIKPGETDLKKMRVGSITILTDADPDGKHIASLLLAFFKVYYPEIVRQRKLRYINGPLFMGQIKETRFFGDDKIEVIEKFPAGVRAQVRMTRFKGWGEATAEQLETIAFDPNTRRLVVLSMSDSDELRIGNIMGHDADHRKELLFGTSTTEGEQ